MLGLSKGIAVVLLLSIIHFYLYSSDYVKSIDYQLYDGISILFNELKEQDNSAYSVVVDIDEQSIEAFGQWPWSRILDAELINRIYDMNPSSIGVNILFPEADRLSPLSIQTFYQKHFDVQIDLKLLPIGFQDNDKLLSEVLIRSNATLSISLKNRLYSKAHCEEMQYKGNIFAKQKLMFYGDGLLCNHASLQNNIENFGFINAWRDDDGILRRVPLFMQYKEEVFPSFALATILSFYDDVNFNREKDPVLINFSKRTFKVLSAADILNDKVLQSDIQGKVVILGSSLIGTNSNYRVSNNEEISNSMIHAHIVENILNDTLLVQPQIYKKINIFLSFFLSLIILVFLMEKKYLRAFIILIIFGAISFLSLLIMYTNGVYISIGYLWTPFLSFFIILIIYHLKVISKEQQIQEKLLIKQSKLASMGEMISLIAHQWRQPLSAINGTVLNMDMDYRSKKLGSKKFDKYLNDIEGTTAYLSKTINDFTDFFSRTKKAEKFNISSVILQAKTLALLSPSKDIDFIYLNSEEIEMRGYSSELVQSILVLLNNAIYICNENLESIKKGNIILHVVKSNKKVLISVEDNGGGIKRSDIKKIFNPYFTTKSQQNGTGLGLYILKLIIEDSMDGKVFVRNGDKGAIFTIEIPLELK